MTSPSLELIVDLTTSVHAGRRSAGMSRVEREFARHFANLRPDDVRCVAWSGDDTRFDPTPAPGSEQAAPTRSPRTHDRRVLLVTGGSWLSNARYLRALDHQRRALDSELAVVVHDLLPLIRPHWFPVADATRNSANIAAMTALADLVLVYSESTDADLRGAIDRHELARCDVRRIRLGAGLTTPRTRRTAPRALRRLTDRPFVLYVSTLTYRKNHEFLCNVWRVLAARLGTRTPRLLLVGRTAAEHGAFADRLRRDPELREHVVQLDHVDDDMLDWLYRRCLFTVYPSLYEGWGLPVSESLSYGKVCLAADTSSLREAAGGCTPLLDPFDHAAWCTTVERLSTSPAALREAGARVHQAPRMPTWDDAAHSVLAALETPPAARARVAGASPRIVLRQGLEAEADADATARLALRRRGRLGMLIDDNDRITGVAIAARCSTTAPLPGPVHVSVSGVTLGAWRPDDAMAEGRHVVLVPPAVLTDRALLDVEWVGPEDLPGAAGPIIAVEDLHVRPLTAAEQERADARYRVGWPHGRPIRFGAGHGGHRMLGDGWSEPAPWGVWSDGPAASLTFAPFPAVTGVMWLQLRVRAFIQPQAPRLAVRVLLDGHLHAVWRFAHPRDREPAERLVEIPSGRDLVTITFEIPDCRSPRDIGLGDDPRRLGVGLLSGQWFLTRPRRSSHAGGSSR